MVFLFMNHLRPFISLVKSPQFVKVTYERAKVRFLSGKQIICYDYCITILEMPYL